MGEEQAGHQAHTKKAQRGILDAVSRPLKVVYLGAGSSFFARLFADILNIPGADKGEMALVDVDAERLELAHQLGERIVSTLGKNWSLSATADRRAVLSGADYVICSVEVHGLESVSSDYEIPARYGVRQCIGDTTGPGGVMKALRTAPVFLGALKDVEELCPDAWVLNYTNPMSILCLAASRAGGAKLAGLCHSVQGTSHVLAKYVDVPYHEMKWNVGGINHLAWFTELSRDGRDLYPLLFDKARQAGDVYEQDPVRFDMMLNFGYFVTESSGHFSEYLPYYRKRPELIEKYCRDGYRGGSGFYADGWPEWRKESDEKRRRQLAGQEDIPTDRTWEYASWMIQAMETNEPFVAHCTVPNGGLIENLPADGVVEVACLVNRNGVLPTRFGPLPGQCAAICESNMRVYDLAATACIEHSREAAIHAMMVDPLTAAVCCPAEIRQMAEELFEAEKEFLTGF